MAVDDASVYWVDAGGGDGTGDVMKVAKGGGTPVAIATGQGSPGAIALGGSCVYWTSPGASGGGSIMTALK